MSGVARLVEPLCLHQDMEIVTDGPEAAVKQPVRGFGQRDAVGRVTRPAALELVAASTAVLPSIATMR